MINLLSPQHKRELAQEENLRLILVVGTIFLIFLVSLALVLFSVKISTQSKVEALKLILTARESSLKTTENQELRQKVISANQKILELESFYKNKADSLGAVEKIMQTLPEGIRLTSLSWQKKTGRVVISGFSPRRETLFELKNNLEKEKEFSEVDFPPQNWIKASNIDFQVTLKAK